MSVPDQPTIFIYTGNGVTDTFAYGFYLLSDEDIVVALDGVEQTIGFTVNGIGSQSGGAVIFDTAPATGVQIQIYRQVAVERDSDYQRLGDLRADTLNRDFDRLWMALQDNRRDKLSSIRYPIFENLNGELPAKGARLGMLLGFDPVNGVHALFPLPSSIGAGDITPFSLTLGVDFNTGDSFVTLPRAPGAQGNLRVNFDALGQDFAEWSVNGTILTFTSPIPAGVTKIWGYIGTTLSLLVPPNGTITDAMIAIGSRVYNRMNGLVDVRDYGATGTGGDDTAAFSLAAQSAPAVVEMQGAMANGIARSPVAHVHVSAGNYVISSVVDTGGRDVQWHFDNGAVVTGYANLPGKIIRDHQRIGERHYGSSDYAVSLAIRAGDVDYERGAEIMGATDPSGLGVYPDRDSVAVFVDNTAPPPDVDVGNATYTASTIVPTVPLTADQVKKLRVGMMIDTKHAPTKYTGFITGWATNGTSITVSGWYLSPGPGTPAVPANGTGAYVNPITKIWAHNANVQMPPTALASRMVGFELGLLSGKPAAVDPYDGALATWGFDAVNLGSARSSALFIARGDAWHGYRSENQVIGYAYKGANAVMEARALSGDVFFTIAQGGSMEVGLASSANTPSIDFHSSGSAVNDYDARIVSTGGAGGVNGQANLLLQAAFVETGVVRPDGDNTRSCGESGKRWSVVYAATGSINTSDAREKTEVRQLTEPEIAASRELANEIGAYRWLSSVAEKGSAAREHIGMTVQRAIEIMQSHGLDPMAYGFICYDQWAAEDAVVIHHPAKAAVIDEPSGDILEPAVEAWDEQVRPARPAGDLFSFRADQLSLFIARGMEARISALEAVLNHGA